MKSLFILVSYLFVSCLADKSCKIYDTVPNPSPSPDPPSPDSFVVQLDTNVEVNGQHAEPIVIFVNRSWAPLGADRFYSLVKDGFFNQAAFFRVVPDFVVQFGISASPKETEKWNTIIPDDPVLISNEPWTVSYATAGPETRTSQLFINYIDNGRLDEMGFAPFGYVLSGRDTAVAILNPTPGDSNGVDQDEYTAKGNPWILKKYPDISLITCVTFLEYGTPIAMKPSPRMSRALYSSHSMSRLSLIVLGVLSVMFISLFIYSALFRHTAVAGKEDVLSKLNYVNVPVTDDEKSEEFGL